MEDIVKQYRFICSSGKKYISFCGNCMCCAQKTMTITPDTEEEAIEKFKKYGGRITEDGRVIMPEVFCDLAGL